MAEANDISWGGTWEAVPGGGLQRELDAELTPDHPLARLAPRVIGRCRSCDDVVAAIGDGRDEIAVIHLTWRGGPEAAGWPDFIRLSVAEFVRRFIDGHEHL